MQRGTKIDKVKTMDQYTFSIACVTSAFYLFVSIFSFFPYREFKTIEYSANPGFREFMGSHGDNEGRSDPNSYQLDYGNHP